MRLAKINIRDPFILSADGIYYLYGTRPQWFGTYTGGFDVYTSADLQEWSDPIQCFDSVKFGLNRQVNWAPEVHKYRGKYYMFATFTQDNNLRGVYILVSESPMGPFLPHSDSAVTPKDWECLDGTLYLSDNGEPYLVFCHEHTQVVDGTICYLRLSEDLTHSVGDPVYLFSGSSPDWADKKPAGKHYITDGPFLFCTQTGELLLIWSTSIQGQYAQCVARSDNGKLDGHFIHLPPLITNDGGHGMIFRKIGTNSLALIYHSPNRQGEEHPCIRELTDAGDCLVLD